MTQPENPFAEFDDAADAHVQEMTEHLCRAEALDRMEQDVTSWEADFLNRILRQLREDRRPLSQPQIDTLNDMCSKYDVEIDF